jgi:hypothetical protein
MIAAGLIFRVDEVEWINLIFIQSKKGMEDIRVFFYYRRLKFSYVHDPFLTPFSDKVLDQVVVTEAYSFTDGFSRYHQIRIAEEDKKKTTFMIEWGLFYYNVMSFGLKNSPTGFSRIMISTFHGFIHKFLEVYLGNWTIYSLLKEHNGLFWLMLDQCH